MDHYDSVVLSMVLDDHRRLYYTAEDVFNGLTVEDAWAFPSELSACSFVDHLDTGVGEPDEVVIEIEYLAAAIAREDQEYMFQLADLRG